MLGERWTLLVLRDLLIGGRRYGELLAGLPGITTNLLAKRLRDLTDAGLILKTDDGYVLTSQGRRAEQAVLSLAEFGTAYLTLPPSGQETMSARNLVLNLKHRFRGDWTGSLSLNFESERFAVTVRQGSLAIDDTHAEADSSLSQQNAGFARWIIGQEPLKQLIEKEAIMIEGNTEIALSFDACLGRATQS